MDNSEFIPHDSSSQPPTSAAVRHAPIPDVDVPLTVAVINVHNLRLRTYIGFNPEEKQKQQDVVINIEIAYGPGTGVACDQVDDALNYKQITKQVIAHAESGRFLLLEKLTTDILAICSNDKRVTRAKVCVDKPHALRFAESVSVTLEYHADQSGGSSEEK